MLIWISIINHSKVPKLPQNLHTYTHAQVWCACNFKILGTDDQIKEYLFYIISEEYIPGSLKSMKSLDRRLVRSSIISRMSLYLSSSSSSPTVRRPTMGHNDRCSGLKNTISLQSICEYCRLGKYHVVSCLF